MGSNVSVNVFAPTGPSVSNKQANSSLNRTVAAITAAMRKYHTGSVIPIHYYAELTDGLRVGLRVANRTNWPNVLVFVTDGSMTNQNAVEDVLNRLNSRTFVLVVVVSNQPVDTTWLNRLDHDGHAKASQIDVIYADREDVGKVASRELGPFLSRVAA